MGTFSAKVEAMTKKYQMQMRVVMRDSVQTTVKMAQEIAKEGGRMRVKTGFLRASVGASIGQMPSGTSINPDPTADEVVFKVDGKAVAATLLRWQPGETLYVGWTANYARPREARDGFLRGAVERWDETVDLTVIKTKQRI